MHATKHVEFCCLLYHNSSRSRGFRNLFQTFRYQLNPGTAESPISIVSKVFSANLEQWLWWKYSQFILENLVEGVAVIMIPQLKRLTIITKRSILHVAAALDPPLIITIILTGLKPAWSKCLDYCHKDKMLCHLQNYKLD